LSPPIRLWFCTVAADSTTVRGGNVRRRQSTVSLRHAVVLSMLLSFVWKSLKHTRECVVCSGRL
jgi:hypothetical protein